MDIALLLVDAWHLKEVQGMSVDQLMPSAPPSAFATVVALGKGGGVLLPGSPVSEMSRHVVQWPVLAADPSGDELALVLNAVYDTAQVVGAETFAVQVRAWVDWTKFPELLIELNRFVEVSGIPPAPAAVRKAAPQPSNDGRRSRSLSTPTVKPAPPPAPKPSPAFPLVGTTNIPTVVPALAGSSTRSAIAGSFPSQNASGRRPRWGWWGALAAAGVAIGIVFMGIYASVNVSTPRPSSTSSAISPSARGTVQPKPHTWVLVLQSLPQSSTRLSGALRRAERLSTPGHKVVVIDSSETPGLNGGYWTVAEVGFHSRADAVSACSAHGRPVGGSCYPRLVTG